MEAVRIIWKTAVPAEVVLRPASHWCKQCHVLWRREGRLGWICGLWRLSFQGSVVKVQAVGLRKEVEDLVGEDI